MLCKFHERLYELRTRDKLSRQTLSEKLGISDYAILRMEMGINQPKYEVLLDIANLFNVSVDYLIGKIDY